MKLNRAKLLKSVPVLLAGGLVVSAGAQPVDIGDRRELFVDRFLVDTLVHAELKQAEPQYGQPPEQPLTAHRTSFQSTYGYGTVFKDGDIYRFYGRRDRVKNGGDDAHVIVYAESKDGINWVEPDLGIYDDIPELPEGNVTLAHAGLATHNFTPFLDTRPGVPAEEKYKGVGGLRSDRDRPLPTERRAKYGPGGLYGFVSADGLRWKRMRDEPLFPERWGAFDSQNVLFWSRSEQCYVCYFRVIDNQYAPGVRAVRRTTSEDLLHWTDPVDVKLNYPGEHFYVNNIKPYFRAPHIYIALPPQIDFGTRQAACQIMLGASRDGVHFERLSDEPFLPPGMRTRGSLSPYYNRINMLSWHVIQTGPKELSLYTYDCRRFVIRLDGFASLHADIDEGEMLTKPLTFKGDKLEINADTAGIGYVRLEIRDEDDKPVPGYTNADCDAFTGDDIAHVMTWQGNADVSELAGKPIRLRFVMKDADVYSLKFVR